jgi:hypothetical protein
MLLSATCLYNAREITVQMALEKRDEARAMGSGGLDFRCVECKMAVVPHRGSAHGGAHFEHRYKNQNCSHCSKR